MMIKERQEYKPSVKVILITFVCAVVFAPWVAIALHYLCALITYYWVWTGLFDLVDFVEVVR